MKRTLCIGLTAALAFACGGTKNDQTANASTSTPAAQSGSGTAADAGLSANAANASNQLVTLTGCLQGDRNMVGTSGSASGAPSSNSDINAAAGRFILANATAGTAGTDMSSANPSSGSSAGSVSTANGSNGSAVGTSGTNGSGIGANGAGASGGPLVSGISSYTLIGNTSELSSHVNQQVRITGRINSSTTGYETTGAATGSGSASNAGAANSGTAAGSASGVGTTSGASGQYSATNNQSGNSGAGMRTVTVDSVQMVSSTCSSPR